MKRQNPHSPSSSSSSAWGDSELAGSAGRSCAFASDWSFGGVDIVVASQDTAPTIRRKERTDAMVCLKPPKTLASASLERKPSFALHF